MGKGPRGSESNMSRGHGIRRYRGHIGNENYTKLQRSVKDIKRNLSVDHILDDLISREVLSIEDGLEIRRKEINHTMADGLIEKLIYVGEEGFHIFVDVLHKNGYGYLFDSEYPGITQNSPTESSDLTSFPEHSHSHQVKFSDQIQQQFHSHSPTQSSVGSIQKPHGPSILTKPRDLPLERRSDLPLAKTMNVADTPSPGKDDDDYDDVDEVDYDDCRVGSKTDNIILSHPIPYRGSPVLFDGWYPVKNMDHRLREYPGCHPDVEERNIKRIIRENKARDGDYVIWYSQKRELLIVTIINTSSPKGRYHYKVKRRRSGSGNRVTYRFSSQMETPSVIELLEYVNAEGLPPPVQKSHSVKGSSSK
ncbi:uncharacterized protein LOC133186063 [Saccostrea echinata]|uniref:uncharacterized protein LOC133186063 n=1 Tax=Saccostrea echinata TaxID=191078 RepID=UPI002A817A14|nr:uncharacterized protein LOC133186063 [Saccostrea echinata]